MLFRKKDKIKLSSLADDELYQFWKLKGDFIYIAEIWKRYTHLMLGVCKKYAVPENECEDVLSEIYEKMQNALTKSTSVENIAALIYIITKNTCFDRLQNTKYQNIIEFDQKKIKKSELIFMEFEDFGSHDIGQELEDKLTKGLNFIPENQRQCLELFYRHEKTYKEIAQELNIDEKDVKSRIQNGKRNLKNYLMLKTTI